MLQRAFTSERLFLFMKTLTKLSYEYIIVLSFNTSFQYNLYNYVYEMMICSGGEKNRLICEQNENTECDPFVAINIE